MSDIMIVAGTRPEIIKVSRLLPALEERGLSFSFVYASQHDEYNMSRVFLEELDLTEYVEVIRNHATLRPVSRMADIMVALDERFVNEHPSTVVVQGDTNATLAASLVALKNGARVAHIEAGLRSNDFRMPEEYNRRMLDHSSFLLFAPTARAEKNLLAESVPGKVTVTGNTIIDAVEYYSRRSKVRTGLETEIPEHYVLATFHRAENVDDLSFLKGLVDICYRSPLPIVLPLHPRTRRRLSEFRLLERVMNCKNLSILPPVGYLEFLGLMKNCRLVLTDSGGVQEEVTSPSVRKRVIVARSSTERPEAQEAGYASVVGTDPQDIVEEIGRLMCLQSLASPCPFGDGRASDRIVDELESLHAGGQRALSVMGRAS